MKRTLGAPDTGWAYIEALPPGVPGGPLPMGAEILANIPNNHLQYAITWYALAVAELAIYLVWARQQLRKQPAS